MNRNRRQNLLQLCRLCGRCERHDTDIFEKNVRIDDNNTKTLCETIFICVGIKVKKDEKMTTKLCDNCVIKINYIVRYQELCAATDMQMKTLMSPTSETGDSAIEPLNFASKPAIAIEDRYEAVEKMPRRKISVATRKRRRNLADFCDLETSKKKFPREDLPSTARSIDDRMTMNRPTCKYVVIERPENIIEEYSAVKLLLSTLGDGDVQQTISSNGYGNTTIDKNVPNEIAVEQHIQKVNVAEIIATHKKRISAKMKKKLKDEAVEERFHVECKAPRRGGCRELFESTDAMMYHVSRYHAKNLKRKFCCHLCGQAMAGKRPLQQHMIAVHLGLKRFMCPFPKCSLKFARNTALKRHTNAIHTKKIAFECTMCRKKFYRKEHLHKHVANRHGKLTTCNQETS